MGSAVYIHGQLHPYLSRIGKYLTDTTLLRFHGYSQTLITTGMAYLPSDNDTPVDDNEDLFCFVCILFIIPNNDNVILFLLFLFLVNLYDYYTSITN